MIAAGLLGPQNASRGGAAIYILGVLMHFLIVFSAATIYFAASRRLHFLIEYPLICGLFFGVAIDVVMRLIVLPLSAMHAMGPYLFEPEFGVVDLDTAVPLTTPEDIGALTAEIVFAEPTIRNEIVYLAGDTVTYGEVADKLEAALHRPFRRSEWTVPFLMEELARDPQNMMRMYRAAFAQGRGVAWNKDGTFNQRHAIPVTDVAAWIEVNLAPGRNGQARDQVRRTVRRTRHSQQATLYRQVTPDGGIRPDGEELLARRAR